MGIITDFVVANADEAGAILSDGYPYAGREFFECKGLFCTEVQGVMAVLAEQSGDASTEAEFEQLETCDSGDTLVLLVPDETRDRLASATETELRAATAIMIENDRAPAYTPDEWREQNVGIADAIVELGRLASHARAVGKSILQYVAM